MESEVEFNVKKLDNDARIPEYTRDGDAAKDIRSAETCTLWPGEIKAIKTGLAVAVPAGYVMNIYSRSGLAFKGIMVSNGVGVIDSNYRGEVGVLLFNATDEPFFIKVGDRIAQIAINKVISFDMVEVTDLDDTERGSAGFGSSGTQ